MLTFTYKIKKRSKDKGDYRITKHGQMAEFSLRELNRNIEQVRKQAKEMEANAKLQGALLENIQRANPDLMAYMNKLSPKKRHALIMLSIQENKARQFKDQEKEVKRILRHHKPQRRQKPRDPLAIILIHLTPVGGNMKRRRR
jgi:hypothetical protein